MGLLFVEPCLLYVKSQTAEEFSLCGVEKKDLLNWLLQTF
jgi:hypothetical protein